MFCFDSFQPITGSGFLIGLLHIYEYMLYIELSNGLIPFFSIIIFSKAVTPIITLGIFDIFKVDHNDHK